MIDTVIIGLSPILRKGIEKTLGAGKSIKYFFARVSKTNKKGYGRKAKIICPICKLKKETEARYIATFIESFNEPEFLSSYRSSFGLCLPHLRKVIDSCRNKNIIRDILNIELGKMKVLSAELSDRVRSFGEEIQRKYDYRFSCEKFQEEGNAWIRAVEKMVGKEGVEGVGSQDLT